MQLARILLYPIKSLDAVSVSRVRITAGGCLEQDRAYALFDGAGKVINGKRTDRVHALRNAFSDDFREVTLWCESESEKHATRFILTEPEPIHRWLSDFFGMHVELRHNATNGFPDDSDAFGPTLVSEASLREVQSWFPALTLESIRRRFRANLELDGAIPFEEDRLFGAPGELKPFRLGNVHCLGHNPCQRCVVPTRDPESGEAVTGFQKIFMARRKETLPDWAHAERFNHSYRFAINTSIPPGEAGKELSIGDILTL